MQIVSVTPESPEIQFTGSRALVGIRNSDPFNYRFAWKLRLGEKQVNGSCFDLPAYGTRYIEFAPPPQDKKVAPLQQPVCGGPQTVAADFPSAAFLTAGTLKDEVVKGSLLLEPDFGTEIGQPVAAKEIPVAVRLSFWGDNLQQFSNAFWVFLLLALGGAVSIWVNCGIPNIRRGLSLCRRIVEIDLKIKGLGTSLDSRWRVMLQSHLPGMREELRSGPWWFPSFGTTLDRLNLKIGTLQEWVDIAYTASLLMHRAGERPEMFPPSVLRAIQERCTRALTPIESGFTKPEELEAMRADLNAARHCLEVTLAGLPNPDLEKEIAAREDRTAGLVSNPAAAPPQFAGLIQQAAAARLAPLSPDNCIARDIYSLKLDLVRVYQERLKQVPVAAAAPGGGPAPSSSLLRLQAHGERLAEYLIPDTHESLRIAVLLVNEMRQDIFADSDGPLAAALQASPPAVMITHDPDAIRVNTPVRFALSFGQQLLNEAVARQEWRCAWDFGDGCPREYGWEVFHSFAAAGQPTIRVTIHDLKASPVKPDPPPAQVTVAPHDSSPYWFEPETKVEIARLGIVLALALFGLLATAQAKAETLTFLEAVSAVIALGFGAGTVKNLVLRASSD